MMGLGRGGEKDGGVGKRCGGDGAVVMGGEFEGNCGCGGGVG